MALSTDNDYPQGPCPPACGPTGKPPDSMLPGQGILAPPFESEKILDLTFKLGPGSGIVAGLCFQLGKWGYDTAKVDTFIDVSPVFTEYYNLTMEEKRKLEGQIKNGFASLMQAVQDYELIDHDIRKYSEYLDYFQNVEKAKEKLEEIKKKHASYFRRLAAAEKMKDPELKKQLLKQIIKPEELQKAEDELTSAQHITRALFVDMVDAHTGEGISMRSIAPRWPTIITDFIMVQDDWRTPEDIIKGLGENISMAEAIVLKTKNELFLEWKNRLFLPTIKERFERLKSMASSRKASIVEYRNEIKPLLSRYKAFVEHREKNILAWKRLAFYRPDSQAMSIDQVNIWAWRPFVVEQEPFRPPRESFSPIPFSEAGFNDDEIKLLRDNGITNIPPMPVAPVMDDVIRHMMEKINKTYNVQLTVLDVYEVIKGISSKFTHPIRPSGTAMGPRWPFSPYYIYMEFPVTRTVLKFPDGSLYEDIWFEPMKAWNASQNIIISKMLELKAMDIVTEREVLALLGEEEEVDPKQHIFKKVDDIIKERYPEFYSTEAEKLKKELEKAKSSKDWEKVDEIKKKLKEMGEVVEKKKTPVGRLDENIRRIKEAIIKLRRGIGKFFSNLGIDILFIYPGPYEKFMHERMTKMMQRGPGVAFDMVDRWLKKAGGVPGG